MRILHFKKRGIGLIHFELTQFYDCVNFNEGGAETVVRPIMTICICIFETRGNPVSVQHNVFEGTARHMTARVVIFNGFSVVAIEQHLFHVCLHAVAAFHGGDCGFHVAHFGVKQEIVLHVYPILGPRFVQSVPDQIHAGRVAALIRRFHAIFNPRKERTHFGAVGFGRIVIHAKPRVHGINVLPMIQHGMHRLLEQIQPFAGCECEQYAATTKATTKATTTTIPIKEWRGRERRATAVKQCIPHDELIRTIRIIGSNQFIHRIKQAQHFGIRVLHRARQVEF